MGGVAAHTLLSALPCLTCKQFTCKLLNAAICGEEIKTSHSWFIVGRVLLISIFLDLWWYFKIVLKNMCTWVTFAFSDLSCIAASKLFDLKKKKKTGAFLLPLISQVLLYFSKNLLCSANFKVVLSCFTRLISVFYSCGLQHMNKSYSCIKYI